MYWFLYFKRPVVVESRWYSIIKNTDRVNILASACNVFKLQPTQPIFHRNEHQGNTHSQISYYRCKTWQNKLFKRMSFYFSSQKNQSFSQYYRRLKSNQNIIVSSKLQSMLWCGAENISITVTFMPEIVIRAFLMIWLAVSLLPMVCRHPLHLPKINLQSMLLSSAQLQLLDW